MVSAMGKGDFISYNDMNAALAKFETHINLHAIKHDYEQVVLEVKAYLGIVHDYENTKRMLTYIFKYFDNFGLSSNPVLDDRLKIPVDVKVISEIFGESDEESLCSSIEPQTFPIPSHPDLPFVEGMLKHFADLGYSERSQSDHVSIIMRFIRFCDECNWDANSIYDDAVDTIERYFDYLLNTKNLAYKTIYTHSRALKLFYEMLERDDGNPADDPSVIAILSEFKENHKNESKNEIEANGFPLEGTKNKVFTSLPTSRQLTLANNFVIFSPTPKSPISPVSPSSPDSPTIFSLSEDAATSPTQVKRKSQLKEPVHKATSQSGKRKSYVLSEFNLVIPSQNSASSLEHAMDLYLMENLSNKVTRHKYKSIISRFLKWCQDQDQDPAVPYDDAVALIIHYFTLNSNCAMSMKSLKSHKPMLTMFYEMLECADNPVEDEEVANLLLKLTKQEKQNEEFIISSVASLKEEQEEPVKVNINESSRSKHGTSKKHQDILGFYKFKIPTQPTAKSLEEALNLHLESQSISHRTVLMYRSIIVRYLEGCKELGLNPNLDYEDAVETLIAYYKHKVDQGAPSAGFLCQEKTVLKNYYDMMGRTENENPTKDVKINAAIRKYMKKRDTSDVSEDGMNALELQLEAATKEQEKWDLIYELAVNEDYDELIKVMERC